MSVFTGILLDELVNRRELDYQCLVDRLMDRFEDELERLGGADIPLPDGGSVRVIECERLGQHEFRVVCGCHCGGVDAGELRALCQRRLWPEGRNADPGVLPEQFGRVIDCGRRPGYPHEKAALLGRIAERAAEHGEEVTWG